MHTSMPTIKELVIPLEQFPHLNSASSIHEAVGQLFSCTISGESNLLYDELLIINDQDEYVGHLTMRSILICYFPSLFDGQQKEIFAGKKEKFTDLAILLEDSFQSQCKLQGNLPVSQFISLPKKSLKADLHPLHAVEILMEENENSLPVVEDGALIGVIRLIDLFKTLAGACSL
nr:CBS domain-containing protein [uncultured Desulfobulbus sp.]